MNKKKADPIKVDQIFSKTANQEQSLTGLKVSDGDITYRVEWDATGPTRIQLIQPDIDNLSYTITKTPDPKVFQCGMYGNQATIYERKNTQGKTESFVALALRLDKTVHGGIILDANVQKASVMYGDGRWAEFLLSPTGIKYVYKPLSDWAMKLNSKGMPVSDDANEIVIIDGKATRPVILKETAEVQSSVQREQSMQSKQPLFVKRMAVLGALSKLPQDAQYEVLDQIQTMIQHRMAING